MRRVVHEARDRRTSRLALTWAPWVIVGIAFVFYLAALAKTGDPLAAFWEVFRMMRYLVQ